MLPDNETITFEDQLYVNPEASLNEQNAFIDNLRGLQNQNNAEINTQTTNLGTYPASQSNLGGLAGGSGYWTSRFQTPQTNSLVANLKSAAMAQALNDILSNELAMQKQRYNNAYKAARRRAGSYGGGGGGNNPSNPDNKSPWDGETEDIVTNNHIGGDGASSSLGGGAAGLMTNQLKPNSSSVPPNMDNFYITGSEQTQKIQENLRNQGDNLPDWMVNILKLFN